MNKRAKTTQPNPSPSSSARQNERKTSRTRSPRGKSQWENVSTALQGLPEKNWHQFILWKVAPSRMLVQQVGEWTQIWWKVLLCASAGWRTVQQKVQKEWWQKCSGHVEEAWVWDPLYTTHQIHDNWGSYFRIWSRRSVHRFYGRAQTCVNRTDV